MKSMTQGESQKIWVYAGILVDVKAYEILAAEQKSTSSMRNTRLALGREGIDVYGNRVNLDRKNTVEAH